MKALTQLPRNWSALYQQRPAPDTGDYFKAEWFHTYTRDPPRQTLNIYGGSDYAVTSDGGDYTVHVVIGVDPENRMYLLDLWRGQTSSDVWIEHWCDFAGRGATKILGRAMPHRHLVDDPEFWRSGAEEVRVIADDMKETEAKAIMEP